MAPTIPDRWLDYKPIGKRIEGTRFIGFKVPLREQVNQTVDADKQLDSRILLKTVPNLGMIIDLTNTNRYYDSLCFVKKGLMYSKLMIPGHHTPAPHLVNQFKRLVRSFLDENMNNDKLIGVHCTHGVNRTGYLICNYMISELAMQPADAIEKFATARGHNIERKNYIDSLQRLARKSSSGSYNNYKPTALHYPKPEDRNVHQSAPSKPTSWRVHPEPLPPPALQTFDRRDRYERCRQDTRIQSQSYGARSSNGGSSSSYSRAYGFSNTDGNSNRYSKAPDHAPYSRARYIATDSRKPYDRTTSNADTFHRNQQHSQSAHSRSNERHQPYRRERHL